MLRFPFRFIRQMTMCNRDRLWKNGETLSVGFMATAQCTAPNTTPDVRLRAAVKKYAPAWEPFANIKFKFVEDHEAANADIRIEMVQLPKTSYSAVGHQARASLGGESSMFLQGSLENHELPRVIMHEFGHILGAEHEHQRSDTGITWNECRVLFDYVHRKRETNNVVSDVFNVNADALCPPEERSTYDRLSIMHYPVPGGYTTNNIVVDANRVLSKTDKSWINKYYPHPPREIRPHSYTFDNNNIAQTDTHHFSREFTDPPKITLALTGLKATPNLDICANTRTNFTDGHCDIHLGIISTAANLGPNARRPNLISAEITSLETARDDPTFQVGVFGAISKRGKLDDSKYIKFERPFLEPNPVVIVWLKSLHYKYGDALATRIKVSTEDRTPEGFTIKIVSSDDSYFHSAAASWVAYPSDMPGTHTGVIIPAEVAVNFPANTFTETPKLLLAATELDFGVNVPVDFEVYGEELDQDGMDVGVGLIGVGSSVNAVYLALDKVPVIIDDVEE